MKRIFRIQTTDKDLELEISKVDVLENSKKIFNLEELPDGTYQLIWLKGLFENLNQIVNIDILCKD